MTSDGHWQTRLSRAKVARAGPAHPSRSLPHIHPSRSLPHIHPSRSLPHRPRSLAHIHSPRSLPHIHPSRSLPHRPRSLPHIHPPRSLPHIYPPRSLPHIHPPRSLPPLHPPRSPALAGPGEPSPPRDSQRTGRKMPNQRTPKGGRGTRSGRTPRHVFAALIDSVAPWRDGVQPER